ncbi:PQQ-binding-like beta-propeller repeat protein [Tuwongella immobilis]|uniref:Pyrrolo-quinoline quinone repeat domain-containing protein n=1 Tax=Tuwongella immobilis TaxID=692036 RepID=A0A6C2YNE4_9BACT|nr:PQQ-binding-like beta-propeller repeat protein [Tuwongella immobilis]VIP03138.1 Serine/threonine protein kinase related protein OS=uncultured bacterium FLS18 PE=4 SV=1: PQQ_2 [Tuwongella immobilis]VTS03502.1 Serine/threonine protein kinase related protein OS=uncultured bacterium FLS18 PE=4 SV=1: PQQ_2 [Tuwongella immobilis]
MMIAPPFRRKGWFVGWLIVVALASSPRSGLAAEKIADWPQWRGPDRTGISSTIIPPRTWPKTLAEAWSVEVGTGHSSPVIADGLIYQFARQGDDEVVLAIDPRSGAIRWNQRYPQAYQMDQAAIEHGKGPKSTPVVHDGMLITLGISGTLSAWDAKTGKQLWQQRTQDRFPLSSPLYGTAMSPLIVDGRLIVHLGGNDRGSLEAIDPTSGKPIWTASTEGPAYASPIVATLAKQRQLVAFTQQSLLGIDLLTGKSLWKLPYTTGYTQNSVTPVVANEQLIFSGYQNPLVSYRLEATGTRLTPRQVWSNSQLPLYMSSPILTRDRLFGFTQRNSGKLFAAQPQTGQVLWESDPRLGENAALLLLGSQLLTLTSDGKLIVLDAEATRFQPIREYAVGTSQTWAHPVPCGDWLLIKDATHLRAYRWRAAD